MLRSRPAGRELPAGVTGALSLPQMDNDAIWDLLEDEIILLGMEIPKLQKRICFCEVLLERLHVEGPPEEPTNGAKRYLSPAARKRISAAQTKRWKEHRKRAAAAAAAD
jgi:hypothetical protein